MYEVDGLCQAYSTTFLFSVIPVLSVLRDIRRQFVTRYDFNREVYVKGILRGIWSENKLNVSSTTYSKISGLLEPL